MAKPAPLSRRDFCRSLGAAVVASGCSRSSGGGPVTPTGNDGPGRLTSRPAGPPAGAVSSGIQALDLSTIDRRHWLLVPSGYTPATRWPLALFFRGAITPADVYLEAFQPFANEFGLVILAPEAADGTWDLVLGGFGPDVATTDQALAETFQRVNVDPARISISGFSDGGSYALSLGVTNGDFLTRVAAYSPGFFSPATRRGQPQFFITHGTQDAVLPVDATSRPIVSLLRSQGYQVDYREFQGPHAVSLTLARESIRWMAHQ